MIDLDARGKPCPQPVLMARQAIDDGAAELAVLVDNRGSADNVRRYTETRGYEASEEAVGSGIRLTLRRTAGPAAAGGPATLRDHSGGGAARVILITADTIGGGSEQLGRILVLSMLNTLAESARLPERIILMNAGVRLACDDDDTVAALSRLVDRGVEVLACGTCLKFFELAERLRAGRPSNALEILDAQLAGNVITWG